MSNVSINKLSYESSSEIIKYSKNAMHVCNSFSYERKFLFVPISSWLC